MARAVATVPEKSAVKEECVDHFLNCCRSLSAWMLTSRPPPLPYSVLPVHIEGNGDQLIIAGRTFRSRLMIGTGKFPSVHTMRAAIRASGARTADDVAGAARALRRAIGERCTP